MHRTALLLSLCLATSGLISGCAFAYEDEDDTWISDLAIPKPISLGIDVVGSDIVAARAATAAAVLQQPEIWGLSVTGRELTLGAVFPEQITRLDSATNVVHVSSNEVHLTVPWAGANLPLGFVVEMCVQVVHFPGGNEKYLGDKDCAEYE